MVVPEEGEEREEARVVHRGEVSSEAAWERGVGTCTIGGGVCVCVCKWHPKKANSV